MTQPNPVSPSTVMRITLRLDNGTLIASHPKWGATGERQAVMIRYDEGFEKGVVTESDVKRISGYVNVLTGIEAVKRRKSEQLALEKVASLPVTPVYKEPVKRPPKAKQPPRELPPWVFKCKEIVSKIRQHKDSQIFRTPVNLTLVTDYEGIVVRKFESYLMDLETLGKNLSAGKYATPEDFAIDMDTIWANCEAYNPKGTEFARAGLMCRALWLSQWDRAGLGAPRPPFNGRPRGRRSTAGQPSVSAPRWDPPHAEVSDSKRSRGDKRRSSPVDHFDDPMSRRAGEVVSSGRDARGLMDSERLKQLGAVLEEMDEPAMEGIIEIVRATGQYDGIEEDEIELDLDNLPQDALWKLDDYAKQVTGGRYNPEAALEHTAGARRGPQIEGDSSDETDDDD